MYLVITDLFRENSNDIQGDAVHVEAEIRKMFPGLLDHILPGDLKGLLRAVDHMYGYSLVIVDASGLDQSKSPPVKRPRQDDPWEREGDRP